MKKSGSIRRTELVLGRFAAGRESALLLAFQDGTASLGPDAHHSGPTSFSAIGPPNRFCKVPKSVPQRAFISYLIPPERKSRSGTTRRKDE